MDLICNKGTIRRRQCVYRGVNKLSGIEHEMTSSLMTVAGAGWGLARVVWRRGVAVVVCFGFDVDSIRSSSDYVPPTRLETLGHALDLVHRSYTNITTAQYDNSHFFPQDIMP